MAKYSPLSGESIYDVAVKLYGDTALGLSVLLAMNVVSLNATDLYGATLDYDEDATRKVETFVIPENQDDQYDKYVGLNGESIYDISVKLYKDAPLGLEHLLSLNDITLTTDLKGVTLNYREGFRRIKEPFTIPIKEQELIYTPLNGETLYDVAIKLYNDVSLGIEQILTRNTVGLSTDLIGLPINYVKGVFRKIQRFVVQDKLTPETYTTRANQSTYDLAIQLYSSMSGLPNVLGKFNLDSLIPVNSKVEYTNGRPFPLFVSTDVYVNVPRSIHEFAIATDSTNGLWNTFVSILETGNAQEVIDWVDQDRRASELANATDTPNAVRVMLKSVTETITATDSPNRVLSVLRSVTEAVTAQDSPTAIFTVLKSISEPATAIDTVTGLTTVTRSVSEPVTAIDSTNRVFIGLATITETLSATDSTNRGFASFREVNERRMVIYNLAESKETIFFNDSEPESRYFFANVEVFDSTDALNGVIKSSSEAGNATDSPNRTFIGLGLKAEPATATDSPNSLNNVWVRVQSEPTTATDTVTGLGVFPKSISEPASANDTKSALLVALKSIAEPLSAVDTINSINNIFNVAKAEPNTATDTPTGQRSFVKSISETATANDSVNRFQSIFRLMSEGQLYIFNDSERKNIIVSNSAESRQTFVFNANKAIDTPNVGASTWLKAQTESVTAIDSKDWVQYTVTVYGAKESAGIANTTVRYRKNGGSWVTLGTDISTTSCVNKGNFLVSSIDSFDISLTNGANFSYIENANDCANATGDVTILSFSGLSANKNISLINLGFT